MQKAYLGKSLCAGLLLLAGCHSAPAHLVASDIRPLPYGTNATFISGLRASTDSARARGTPVRVLFIHGMLTDAVGYSTPHQMAIAARMGLKRAATDSLFPVVRGYSISVLAGSQPFAVGGATGGPEEVFRSIIRKSTWVADDRDAKPTVIFYELTWAPLRDWVKNRFLACYETGPVTTGFDCTPYLADYKANTARTAQINAQIKKMIMVGGLADAAIVLSPLGDVLRDDMRLAMCMISRDVLHEDGFQITQAEETRCSLASLARNSTLAARAAGTLGNARFFAITHSLGSFLLLDGQTRAAAVRAESDEDMRIETMGFYLLDQKTMFMLANQISLLTLGRLRALCLPTKPSPGCPNKEIVVFGSYNREPMPLSTMTTWVAFNDKDDLLGYELPGFLPTLGVSGRLVNVTVQNPGWRFLSKLKDPSGAHTRQAENAAIIEAIVEGFHIPRQ